mmetsp:Transcript_6498/g.8804  ORF Transcript_6498/g.8804 Transcript_6498/m.8804 type:complete len:116 (-) Transcript_6498:389-736(-)
MRAKCLTIGINWEDIVRMLIELLQLLHPIPQLHPINIILIPILLCSQIHRLCGAVCNSSKRKQQHKRQLSKQCIRLLNKQSNKWLLRRNKQLMVSLDNILNKITDIPKQSLILPQ